MLSLQHPFALSADEEVRGDIMKKRILAGTSSSVALDVLDDALRDLIEAVSFSCIIRD
jgi:hypothetical protein